DVPPSALAVRAQHERALARPDQHTYPAHRTPSCAARRPHPSRLNGRTRRGPGGRRHHGPAPGPGLSRPITALRRCDVGRSAESSRGDAPCWRQYPGWCPGIRAGGKRRSRLRLLEVGLEPDLLAQVVLDRTDVVLGRGRAPAPGEPAADATPCVAGPVRPHMVHRVQPRLVAVEARPPDRVGGVCVHRGGGGDARPAALFVGVPVLQDAPALRAQARLAVHPGTVAGRAAVALPVAERGLPPPAFHRGLGEHDALVDAPFAGRPAQDLAGGPGGVALDPLGDHPVRLARLAGPGPRAGSLGPWPGGSSGSGPCPRRAAGPAPTGRTARRTAAPPPAAACGSSPARSQSLPGQRRPGQRRGAPGQGSTRPRRCPPRPPWARPRPGHRWACRASRGPSRGAGETWRALDLAVPPSRTPRWSAAGPARRPPKPAASSPSPARVA